MISCEKAADICTRTQYKEASFWEKLKLGYHLIFCKICSAYTRKNKKLTKLCQKAQLHTLSEADKLNLKQQIEKHP